MSEPSTLPSSAPVKHSHPNYIGIFIGLAVLTALELTVAFLPWHKRTLILLLIGLAVWKALLVALYFMHLRFERGRLREVERNEQRFPHRSEEHTSELQSLRHLVCRLLLEKKKKNKNRTIR